MFNRLINNLRRFFGISRTEANGLVILILCTIIIIFSPLIYRKYGNRGYENFFQDSLLLDSIRLVYLDLENTQNKVVGVPKVKIDHKLFHFNPNSVKFNEMIILGFDTVIAKRIIKYRNSGGEFKSKADLLKIYDFSEDLYGRIVNYIDLPEAEIDVRKIDHKPNEAITKTTKELEDNRPAIRSIDINKADTILLKSIYGIGDVLSMRIIKYRELLGGFVNPDQLDEVYGLKGESMDNLRKSVFVDSLYQPKQIRINFAEWDDLVKHPYIDATLASELIKVRSITGPYNNPEDLKRVSSMNDSIFYKLFPYFDF